MRIGRWGIVLLAVVSALGLPGRALAQDNSRYFESTGQTLDNQYGFLDFWTAHDGAVLFGDPLTAVVIEGNVPVQYFERARLEQRNGAVVPGELGRERTRWRSFAPAPPRAGRDDIFVSGTTGHSLAGPFLRYWLAHRGVLLFGQPISEPLWEQVNGNSVRVQYFERVRLEYYPALDPGSDVKVSALGREIALAKALITPEQKPAVQIVQVVNVDRPAAAFSSLLPPTPTPIPPTPTPAPPTAVPATRVPPTPTPRPRPQATAPRASGKVIDVNLSTQQLVAYENGQVVFSAPVATGKDGFNTPAGTFEIYSKTPLQTMRGSAGGETWVVPNVPHAMYIFGGVALHGAYWHNNFGTGIRMSHGCINLPLDSAAWLYNWAPVGTTVVVHY